MTAILETQSILDQIVAKKRHRLDNSRKTQPLGALREQFEQARNQNTLAQIHNFTAGLHQHKSLGVIAEIKKASPSKGIIQPDFHPAEQALAYADAGVQAISVLTEEDYFSGSLEDLMLVRSQVSLPLLRKDFIIEPGQIYEARLAGASAVLLICALLDDQTLAEYLDLAHQLGLAALVEIHDLPELMRVLAVGATLIGINNRNLRTFRTDLQTSVDLTAEIPAGVTVVSESGIRSRSDIDRLRAAGIRAFLVGESLMRASTPAGKLKELVGR